ncbi:MAG: FAD-dependent oxidoreductase, partial [Pseudomonadota bacterium]|nr:FAD-dependent oxidoreductase [Pseudomonadota bacterium]
MASQHFIIVGAGIVGASLAFALTRRGQRVTVIERHAPAAGASSKSFAWLNANYPDTAAYFRLRIEALEHYRELSKAFDLGPVLRFGGSLWWEDEGTDFDRHVALLES